MRETGRDGYQTKLIKEIKDLFPGCIVMKNDSSYIQGIPDLTVLYKDRWAAIEVKASRTAKRQPNQLYYITKLDEMSFACVAYPEIHEEVINGLQQAFGSCRSTRLPESE